MTAATAEYMLLCTDVACRTESNRKYFNEKNVTIGEKMISRQYINTVWNAVESLWTTWNVKKVGHFLMRSVNLCGYDDVLMDGLFL